MWKRHRRAHQSWMTVFATAVMEWTPPILLEFDIVLLNPAYLHLNRSLYWIEGGQDRNNRDRRNILCFGPYRNNFRRIALPLLQDGIKWKLSACNNLLAITGCSEFDEMTKIYNVWIEKPDSGLYFTWEKH